MFPEPFYDLLYGVLSHSLLLGVSLLGAVLAKVICLISPLARDASWRKPVFQRRLEGSGRVCLCVCLSICVYTARREPSWGLGSSVKASGSESKHCLQSYKRPCVLCEKAHCCDWKEFFVFSSSRCE